MAKEKARKKGLGARAATLRMKEPFRVIPAEAAEAPASTAVLEAEPPVERRKPGRKPRQVEAAAVPAKTRRGRKPGAASRSPLHKGRRPRAKIAVKERRILVHKPKAEEGERVEVKLIPVKRERPAETHEEHISFDGAPWMMMDFYWKSQRDAWSAFYESWTQFQQMGMQIFFGMWNMR
jgi:hypothetical protein